MTTSSTADLTCESALALCATILEKIANYAVEPSLQRRLQELGERKEFLRSQEHDELLALIDFKQRRAIESLEAKLALKRLRDSLVDPTRAFIAAAALMEAREDDKARSTAPCASDSVGLADSEPAT